MEALISVNIELRQTIAKYIGVSTHFTQVEFRQRKRAIIDTGA